MMEQYELVEKISKGTCNVFYKARDRKTSEIVFVKIIRPKENKKGLSRSFVREPALLKSLKHKNIIRLHARVANKEQCYLVYEYLDMNLGKYMDSYPEFSKDPRLVKTFLYQILCAIDFCHVLGVLHRDLKPANLLIDRINNVVKIAGFSLAREFSIPCMPLTRDVGTLWYKAPEILLGSDLYFAPVDVWSIGCIFAEMVNMKPLFRGESEIDQLMRICKLMGIPNEETWPGVTYFTRFDKTITSWTTEDLATAVPSLDGWGLDLLRKMLCVDPIRRITARAAMEHEYFKILDLCHKSPFLLPTPVNTICNRCINFK